VEEHFQRLGKPLTVAVMGCVVNGPGEAGMADLGIAGGKGRGVIFRKGQVVRTVDEKDFLTALIEEGDRVIAEMNGAPPPGRAPVWAASGNEALVPLQKMARGH